jgi:hypothetical protein
MKRMATLSVLAALIYWAFVRPWHLRWGATDEEVAATLPGNENVARPDTDSTRAVTIHAPVRDVWPWLAQLGQHRGGFYSYASLENLVGCHMRNADHIVPEWQSIAPGDQVYLHPKLALKVLQVEPQRTIVLERDWSFHLRPIDERTTRLIVRSRGVYEMPDLRLPPFNFLYWRGVFEPGHFIMERKMMLGIKERAERLAAGGRTGVEDTLMAAT